MPRPQPPLTPASSTDLVARDKQGQVLDMESTFTLPPAAVSPISARSTTTGNIKSSRSDVQQSSPPPSPADASTDSKLQRKRTLSGERKSKAHATSMSASTPTPAHDLPPPPSRARKIIQMKPKQSPSIAAQDQPGSASSGTSKHSSSQPSSHTTTKKSKTQQAATTAAGRKIARKTAHSIIERRRRSKMNEEFGVLKDMIPACTGVEMHKLAILQAGIEYVRYLEGCIEKLKDRNEQLETMFERTGGEDPDDDMDLDAETEQEVQSIGRPPSTAVTDDSLTSDHRAQSQPRSQFTSQYLPQSSQTPSSRVTSANNSTYASPNLRPVNASGSLYFHSTRPSQSQTTYSTLPPISTHQKTHQAPSFSTHPSVPSSPLSFQPPPITTRGPSSINNTPTATPFGTLATGISPAIHAFHFSPDMNRPSMYASSTPGTSISISSIPGHGVSDDKHSPHIAPLPQAALPLPSSSVRTSSVGENPGAAEANATAALLMMGHDRRTSDSASGNVSVSKPPSENGSNHTKSTTGKGMSVKDLLSS